jgi:GH15 family glucan-1,4-alpha-glucosidase
MRKARPKPTRTLERHPRPAASEAREPVGSPSRYAPIEHYGIVGDLKTVALVGLNGSIDFCCLPHFDSPSVFARLLDADEGGHFAIEPELSGVRHKQMYLPDTNVLLTRFLADDGVAEISDFMPLFKVGEPSRIVRRVKAVRGTIRIQMRCAPRFDYARQRPIVTLEEGEARMQSPDERVALRLVTKAPLRQDGDDVVSNFTLAAGQSMAFVLEQLFVGVEPARVDPASVAEWFKDTVNFWRRWIGRSTYTGRWRDEVHRSALVLKLLQSRESGCIVAAPTFGLPEAIGGERNWDYRYTWIRDASFTLYGLIRLGLTGEAKAFIEWLVQRVADTPERGPLQTIYGIDGRTKLPERELEHLEGYMGSRPVRIGNAAYRQLQLDIYGELLDALYLYDEFGEPTSYDVWSWVSDLVDWVCEHWRQPDDGVWEVRSGPREFLYSRVMCWVALDRALRLATKRSFPAPIRRWRETRDAIYRDVFENFWDAEEQTFVGIRGAKTLDAACLIMPLVRFIAPTDPRWLSTLNAIEQRLQQDSLIFRYDIEGPETDGLRGTEGTFSICSFWYIECLSRSGDLQKARFYFDKMLGYANHVGLFAEEVGPKGEHLGNFPQALTHLSLISAAYDLDRRLSGAGWKA